MGAGEELRGGKGSTNQDILQEKKKEKQLNQKLQLGRRQRYISNIQEAKEKGQRLKKQALLCTTVPPSDCSW